MSYLLFFVFTLLLIGPNTSTLAQEIIWEPTSLNGTSMSWRTLFVSSDGAVFAGANTGLRRSTDNGDSWEEVGPPGVNDMEELASGTLVVVIQPLPTWSFILTARYGPRRSLAG